jgi:ABC-2 type transport system permease protein
VTRMFRRQTLAELRVLIRRPEVIGFALMMPLLLMLFFGALYSDQRFDGIKAVNFILPQYAVLAVMSLAFNTVGIKIADDRGKLILKRFAGTPLPRWVLLLALIVSAAFLIILVEIVLVVVGILVFGASIKGNIALDVAILLLAILFFAAMGIISGGLLKPATVPAANPLIFLALGFLGGVFIPIQQFPSGLKSVARILPSERAVDALQQVATYGKGLNGDIGVDLGVLGIWLVVIGAIGVRYFKWE